MNITIIGSGQIGSRHLQSLSNLEYPLNIQLVDPSKDSLKIAKNRFLEVCNNQDNSKFINLYQNIDEIIDPIDICIIATTSNVRANVVTDLLQKKVVSNLILEKFLFQKVNDYHIIKKLLEDKDIPAWVNCWPRTSDLYIKIKQELELSKKIKLIVSGSNWGIGARAIHFLDLFAFYVGWNGFEFKKFILDEKKLETKRAGFTDYMGYITGVDKNGNKLEFVSKDEGHEPFNIRIINEGAEHKIIVYDNHLLYQFINGDHALEKKYPMILQSKMTDKIIKQIIETGTCDLPKYEESMKYHLKFMEAMLISLNSLSNKKIDLCPIT